MAQQLVFTPEEKEALKKLKDFFRVGTESKAIKLMIAQYLLKEKEIRELKSEINSLKSELSSIKGAISNYTNSLDRLCNLSSK